MGLFSRKKKCAPSSLGLSLSPSASFTTICPSSAASSAQAVYASQPFFNPQITLKVALDPAPLDGEDPIFAITVDHDASVSRIRGAIAEKIGHGSISLFKVSLE
jgi:hypothetical protein